MFKKTITCLKALSYGIPVYVYGRKVIIDDDGNFGYCCTRDSDGKVIALGGQDISFTDFVNECEDMADDIFIKLCMDVALNSLKKESL